MLDARCYLALPGWLYTDPAHMHLHSKWDGNQHLYVTKVLVEFTIGSRWNACRGTPCSAQQFACVAEIPVFSIGILLMAQFLS